MNKLTIMIVDDQEDFRGLLAEYLVEEGYDVMEACDGAAALQSINFRKPDLILLDVAIPTIDGFEVCRALKANPETSYIPIIYLSAKTSLKNRLDGYISGAQRYLCKPLDMEELEKWIQLLLHIDANNREQYKKFSSLADDGAIYSQ